MRKPSINDNERHEWILNDEGLHVAYLRSRRTMRAFIRENRKMIDEIIVNVRDGKKPAHYLEYDR